MELDAAMKMKNISERIGNFPALGQTRSHIQIIPARQEIVEDQVVNSFRERIDPHAWIKIRGTRLDDHDQCVGVGLGRTTQKREEKRNAQNRPCRSGETASDRRPQTWAFKARGRKSEVGSAALTHTKSSPARQPASRPWPMAHSTAAGSRFHRPARQMLPLLSLQKANRTRLRSADGVLVARDFRRALQRVWHS